MGTVFESVEYWGNRARREAMGYPEDPADVLRESQVLSREDTAFIVLFQKPIEQMGMAEALSAYLVTLTMNLADRDPVVAKQKARLVFNSDTTLRSAIDQTAFFLHLCIEQHWSFPWFKENGGRLLDAIEMAERIMKFKRIMKFTGEWE